MSIWVYEEIGEPPSLAEIAGQCRFCDGTLIHTEIDDRWVGISRTVGDRHKETVLEMAEIHGDFILKEMEIVSEPDEDPASLGTCPLCGWWLVCKDICLSTKGQIWFAAYGAAASLHKFDEVDIQIPVNEVRQYLVTKYESRYNVHPRRFEEVVASVFSSHGFRSEVTAYSADGGIDVVLRNCSNQAVAIQVKRTRNAIEVASIRELLGAMVLKGYTRGAFVTTSKFQSGGSETVKTASAKGLSVDLIDGPKFFRGLRIAQMMDFARYPRLIEDPIIASLNLQFSYECHGNSL